MSKEICLVGRGKVNEGRIETAQATLAQVVEHVRDTHRGIVSYQHALDPQTGVWMGVETYADNEALQAHLKDPIVGDGLGRFMADLAFEGIVVMGDVSDEVREMMAPFRPTYLGTPVGFSRTGDPKVVGRLP